jgi:hypothetical protein
MLRLMLNRHPRLAVPFESGFVTVFAKRLPEFGDLRQPDAARRLLEAISAYPLVAKSDLLPDVDGLLATPLSSYAELVDRIFGAWARERGKERWGDKTPTYVTDLDVLWALFPGCQIVHLVRDGRDVASSFRGLSWGPNNLLTLAEDWRWKTTLGHKVGRVLGDDHYLLVKYEDLVLHTDDTIRSVCGFLGERVDPRMLDFDEGAADMPSESLAWHEASVRPPDPDKVFAWKRTMPRTDQVIYESIAGDALTMFGYERVGSKSTLGSRFKKLLYAVNRLR